MGETEEISKTKRGRWDNKKYVIPGRELLTYFGVTAVSLIYWEIIMMIRMGEVSASSFFFLFFIPAEALLLTALCGIGNQPSSRITLPVILLIPAFYYIVQTVYFTNFGSLFSISMAGMGTDAVGDFGWALTDSIIESIPLLVLIFLPVIAAIVFSLRKLFKIEPYIWQYHVAVCLLAVLLWFMGIGGIRLFGSERPSPYYLFTSSQATTDATARKLGTLTTGIVESGSYFLGTGKEESSEFIYEEEEEEEPVKSPVTVISAEGENITEEEETVVRTPWINEALDFDKVASEAEDDETRELAEFFSKRKPSETNEYTGMFEGYNLIYICAESFWNYACNEEVTPTLYKMANNGIVLNNYYNSFYNTTTNGEFAFCTSLWPDVSRHSSSGTDIGSFAQSASKYMPQGLGDLFTAQGIPSYAFHNYYGKYYRRILSWPNLGYKCKFTGDGMWFSSNWPASDLELMEQSVDDYINDDQFHAYYMTFSGHGPFTTKNYMFNKNIGEVTDILGEDKYHIDARGYFAGELELDKAMEYLLDRLEEAGKLDNTVIVIAADHYPYYLSDEGRTSLAGYDIDQKFDIYKSSCIIYNAGMEEPMQVDSYCSNIDIAPTILNLFNIPFDSRLMMGRDIFSEQAHNRGTLYNMSFLSDKVRYDYESGKAEWTDEGDQMTADEKDKYLSSQLSSIENEYNAACRAIDDNFFLKAYKICGLLTDEEVKEEEEREASVRSQDETYNAEDEAEELEKQQEKEAQQLLEQMQQTLGTDAVADPNAADPNAAVDPNGTLDPNAGAGAADQAAGADITVETTVAQ